MGVAPIHCAAPGVVAACQRGVCGHAAFQGKNGMNKLQSVGLKSGAAVLRQFVLAVVAALAGTLTLVSSSWAQAAASTAAVSQARPVKLALIESLSGPFANTGEAVFRNIFWAIERVNARGGVRLPATAGGARRQRHVL